MELMPGYKQSEVGPIPSDWDLLLVSELANVDPENLSASTDPNYSFNYISLEQVDFGNLIGTSREVFRTAPSRARRVVRHDDVLMSTVRPNLKAHLHFRSQVSDAICSTGFAVLRAKPDAADPAYIFAHLFASPVNKQIEKTLAGSNYPAINSRDVRELKIPCPPTLREQGVIAQALSDVDALLATLDQVIAKKRDLKQAAMQQLLTGQARLPGFSGEWMEKALGELGEITGAGVDKKIHSNETPVRLLNYMDVYQKDFLKADDFWHEVTAKPDQVKRCGVQRGDVFFTPTSEVRDDIGHSAVAIEDAPDVVYSYHVVRLRLSEVWDIGFRAYAFKTKRFSDQASTQCEGSGTRYVITLPKFRAMTVQYPAEVAEQTAIAAVLSDIDAELSALEARRDKTHNIKQAMMQELLTGKTRLV